MTGGLGISRIESCLYEGFEVEDWTDDGVDSYGVADFTSYPSIVFIINLSVDCHYIYHKKIRSFETPDYSIKDWFI